jgi:hypothetical protein
MGGVSLSALLNFCDAGPTAVQVFADSLGLFRRLTNYFWSTVYDYIGCIGIRREKQKIIAQASLGIASVPSPVGKIGLLRPQSGRFDGFGLGRRGGRCGF